MMTTRPRMLVQRNIPGGSPASPFRARPPSFHPYAITIAHAAQDCPHLTRDGAGPWSNDAATSTTIPTICVAGRPRVSNQPWTPTRYLRPYHHAATGDRALDGSSSLILRHIRFIPAPTEGPSMAMTGHMIRRGRQLLQSNQLDRRYANGRLRISIPAHPAQPPFHSLRPAIPLDWT